MRLARARVSQKPHSGAITCLAVDGTGKILLTGATDHTVRSWDIRSGETLKVFEGHKSSVVCMTVCRVDSSLQRWTWVGSIHGLGWVAFFSTFDGLGWVGLNDIVAEYCKTHTFYRPYFSHFLLPKQYTGITDIDILFRLFLRRHSCEIKDM